MKPHGIRGELRVLPVTDEPDRFSLLDEVIVALKNKPPAVFKISSARLHGGMVILKIEGVDDRGAASAFIGGVIKIPESSALPLGDDEYYFRDLLGMEVFTEDGERLGAIADVLRTGANDVYSVETADKKNILIPAIKSCVLSVSVREKKMTVRLMEGLR